MSKKSNKKHQIGWPEAKKLCRLNQDDIEMAKRLGFSPRSLVRNIPDPKQKWKAPVKYWIRNLYEDKFGAVLGEPPLPKPPAVFEPPSEEEMRLFEEEMFWDDYWDRNAEEKPKKKKGAAAQAASTPPPVDETAGRRDPSRVGITDDDLPF